MTGVRRYKLSTLIFSLLPCTALGQFYGQPQRPLTTLSDTSSEKRVSTGYSVLFGLYPAYLTSKPVSIDTENNRTGFFGAGSVYLSAIGDYLILDGGLGWFYSRIDGEDPTKTIESATETRHEKVEYVGTSAGFADLSFRFRYKEFHIGPQAMVLFGEDTSYAPQVATAEPNVWVGGQLGWIRRTDTMDIRLALRYDTDVTIADRQVQLIGLSAQFGIPFGRQKVTRTVVKERVEIQERKVEVLRPVPVEVLKFVLNKELVNFETDKDALLPDSRIFLENLGRLLVRKRGLWKSLAIEGHTDSRGSAEHNKDLSNRRALSVAIVLFGQGVPRDSVSVQGYGSTRPLDLQNTPVALARNRRVELHFQGVSDTRELTEELSRVRQLTRRPETCIGNQCR